MIFYYCEECGKLATDVNTVDSPLTCCGQEMKILEADTTDAAVEKHVPEVNILDNKIHVVVGSTRHPMADDHYIEMIAVEKGDNFFAVQRLHPGQEPEATFVLQEGPIDKDADGPITVYEFCNLHGLWKSEL